jgi:hypothetical protein
MKKALLTLAMIAALAKASAQEIDNTKTVKDKDVTSTMQVDTAKTITLTSDTTKTAVTPVDNYSGNIELIAGSNKTPYNTYVRSNTFYNLPGKISGYNWIEFYKDGTICGRNTLSKTIASIGKSDKPKVSIGLENQMLYITGIPLSTGLGIDMTFTPTDKILIKPYFTPLFMDSNADMIANTSITGIYFDAALSKHIDISGFGEMNFSAKKPEWSYGELCVKYMRGSAAFEYIPSLTNKGIGIAKPKMNQRVAFLWSF